jgi:hypothetical protein
VLPRLGFASASGQKNPSKHPSLYVPKFPLRLARLTILILLANQITELLFTFLHPITLFAAYIYAGLYSNGRIALPPDEEVYPSGHGRPSERATEPNGGEQGPREVDTDELWS